MEAWATGQIGQIGQLVGLSLLTAGTLLSHYLTALLLAGYYVLCALVWLVQALRRKDFSWRSFRTHLIPIIGASVLGLLMAARWYWRVFRYSFGLPEYGVYLPERD